MREGQVVRLVSAQIDAAGRWSVNVHGTGHGSDDGAPDIVTCDAEGRLLGIECKAPGEAPRVNQWRHAIWMLLSGGRYVIAYDDFDLKKVDKGGLPTVRVGSDPVDGAFDASLDDKRHTQEAIIR